MSSRGQRACRSVSTVSDPSEGFCSYLKVDAVVEDVVVASVGVALRVSQSLPQGLRPFVVQRTHRGSDRLQMSSDTPDHRSPRIRLTVIESQDF